MKKSQPNLPESKEHIIELPFTYRYIGIDIILRIVTILLDKTFHLDKSAFWLCQLVIIPTIVLFYTFKNNNKEKLKKKIRQLNNLPDNSEIKINLQGNAFSIIFVFLTICISCFLSYRFLFPPLQKSITANTFFIFIFVSILYAFYNLIIYIHSYSSLKDNNQEQTPEHFGIDTESVDGNDMELIRQEISISSYSQRVDTYTIESALFGALAFTCFLALLQIDKDVAKNTAKLLQWPRDQIYYIWEITEKTPEKYPLGSKQAPYFYSIIALLSLICSQFYLLVIVSRIRFHDILKFAEFEVKLAREFNQKEENYDLLNTQQKTADINTRLNKLTVEINDILKKSSNYIKQLKKVVNYMNSIRLIALTLFVLLIATSACLIEPNLGIIFILIYILSFTYHKIDNWLNNRNFSGYSKTFLGKREN